MRQIAFFTLAVAALIGFTGAACSNQFQAQEDSISKSLGDSVGCKGFEENFWHELQVYIEANGRPPTADDLAASLQRQIKSSPRLQTLSSKNQSALAKSSRDLIQAVLGDRSIRASSVDDSSTEKSTMSANELETALWLKRIAQLEIGDRTTDEKSNDVDRVRDAIEELKSAALGMDTAACPGGNGTEPPTPTPTPNIVPSTTLLLPYLKSTRMPAVYGGLRAISVMYQSCDVAQLPALDDSTQDIDGISITGSHPSGGGFKREITDLGAFLSGHPYLDPYKRPLPSCFDILKSPPIYDYGGKPFTSAANERLFDLFKNGGSGTKTLGIDCSGLVYTAYAAGGLKMKAESKLKASLVNGVSSTMLKDPQKNGLSCLDYATFSKTESLRPGDIIAQSGHVVMVESVGKDPFGIKSKLGIEGCESNQLSLTDFDFVILQSAPVYGGIGSHRVHIRDYLGAGSTMTRGLLEHAANACKARFKGPVKSVDPTKSASVVRHLGTAQCKEPELTFAKEDCVSSCALKTLPAL